MKDKMTKCQKIAYSIPAIGTRKAPITPKSASHVYQSVCLSKLLYSTEMIEMSTTLLLQMEAFQAQVAKLLQGLPDRTCNLGAVHTMGWLSIQSQIELRKLVFLGQLICLPITSIYKRLLIRRYCYITYGGSNKREGPLSNILSIAGKYDLLQSIAKGIETGNFISLPKWKRLVRYLVTQRDEKEWAVKAPLYPTLERLIPSMPVLEMNAWWYFVQANPTYMINCKSIVKLLLDVHGLNTSKCRYDKSINPLCVYCDRCNHETINHWLFECDKWTEEREQCWQVVLDNSPNTNLRDYLVTIPNCDKVTFLLCCMANSYIVEWNNLYCAIAKFIHTMYNVRCNTI